MALTREQIQVYIALSERATEGPWEVMNEYVVQADSIGGFHPSICETSINKKREGNAEFIAQSRNIGPEIAQWALKLDAENRRMREALDKLLEVACGISRHTGYELCDEEWDALNKAMQALADIDAEGNGQ